MKFKYIKRDLIFKAHYILKKILPICHGWVGPCFRLGKLRQQGSAYHDDKLNWAFLCAECQKLSHRDWQERWSEYWNEVI